MVRMLRLSVSASRQTCPDTLRRKLAERIVNVAVLPGVVTASNGGQYVECPFRAMAVLPHAPNPIQVTSTCDGMTT
jgi:hypothetical protein